MRIVITGLQVPLDWHVIFGVMAALSMTLGNLAAIKQTGIKRMLAYSGIAQAGFLLVGLAASTESGVGSLLFYMIAYGLANIAAFAAVLVVSGPSGGGEITAYVGLSRRSPLTAFVLAVSLLSLAGLPLMAGFIAKFNVFLQAAEAGMVWLVTIGVVNSVISLYYYLRVLYHVYVAEEEPDGDTSLVRIPWRAGLVMALCTLGVFVLGVFPAPMIDAANVAAATLFGG
jgi:NADH-quinone oxidoreductase subunit N